jgi:hypothetical protein
MDNTEKNFNIDFFELAFLTEACLPNSTIARHSFFMDVIDVHYQKMTANQRNHLFQWVTPKLDMKHEESRIFHSRFDPNNQYLVTTNYEGKETSNEAFLFEDKYMIKSNKTINKDYIVNAIKLNK